MGHAPQQLVLALLQGRLLESERREKGKSSLPPCLPGFQLFRRKAPQWEPSSSGDSFFHT